MYHSTKNGNSIKKCQLSQVIKTAYSTSHISTMYILLERHNNLLPLADERNSGMTIGRKIHPSQPQSGSTRLRNAIKQKH